MTKYLKKCGIAFYIGEIRVNNELEFNDKKAESIVEKALNLNTLSRVETEYLLGLRDPVDIEGVFSAAKRIREKFFGNKIFFYGFIYFTTYCRNRCTFCFYRKPNLKSPRYRKTPEEVIKIAKDLEDSGVHLIDLTMSEDPLIHGRQDFSKLLDLLKRVRNEVDIPIMVSPGVVPHKILGDLSRAGADWYACYQETHNRDLFSKLRIDQDYDTRMRVKEIAVKEGMLIEEGILLGVGESLKDRAYSISEMKKINAHQIRAMSFIPQIGTPMENWRTPPREEELLTIAVMRLVHQDKLIPASLDIEGVAGLQARLMAGANVVTSIIPPQGDLAGVAQHDLDIRIGKRTVDGIKPYLKELKLKSATVKDYIRWIEKYKKFSPHKVSS